MVYQVELVLVQAQDRIREDSIAVWRRFGTPSLGVSGDVYDCRWQDQSVTAPGYLDRRPTGATVFVHRCGADQGIPGWPESPYERGWVAC